MSNGKCEVASFKNKRLVSKPADEWVVVEGTHEPIVSKEKWLEAQRLLENNRKCAVRGRKEGEVSLFAGIIKCADCGGNMVFNKADRYTGNREFYRCGTYANKGKSACPPHKVYCDAIQEAVLSDIRKYAALAEGDEEKLVGKILKASGEARAKALSRCEKAIRKASARVAEIDMIVRRLYEDKISGEITPEQFKRLSAGYGEEQARLASELERMEKEAAKNRQDEKTRLRGWRKSRSA
jgi:hypothetical protein